MRATGPISGLALAIGLGALAGCKPPPTDVDLSRDVPEVALAYASDPLPSPDTQGAFWVISPSDTNRLIYGVPGSPALLALECLSQDAPARMAITRLSPADEGAGALLAMVGNGHIGRVEVDAVKVGGRFVWQGETLAADEKWEPLAGPRSVTVTVPGAGMVTVNEGETAMAFLEACRAR